MAIVIGIGDQANIDPVPFTSEHNLQLVLRPRAEDDFSFARPGYNAIDSPSEALYGITGRVAE
jgi:hypothetical protein